LDVEACVQAALTAMLDSFSQPILLSHAVALVKMLQAELTFRINVKFLQGKAGERAERV
jgi:hypothetical protein